jgi:SNF2 family DNA or RNA helicase
VHWWRVVLDEAHNIKEAKTQAARACAELESNRRWCVTGTPFNTSTEDLLGQAAFLKLDSR